MNPENRNQVIIFVVLLIVLGGVLYFFVLAPSGGGGGAQRAAQGGGADGSSEVENIAQNIETAFVEDAVDVDQLLAKIEDVRFDYKEAHDARNPMMPLVGANPLSIEESGALGSDERGRPSDAELLYIASSLGFTGVVYDAQVPLAILDNQLVHEGYEFESYFGISVKEIAQDSVVLVVPLSDGPIEHVQRLKEPETL